VKVDALGGEVFVGKVDQILPEADPGSRTFQVKLLVPNPQGKVRPGFFARATLVSKSETQLVVPKDAVVARGTNAHVVAAREGKAVIVPVKRGASEGSMIAVVGELTEKDQVVTRGNEALRGGEPLMLPPPAPATAPASTTAPAVSAAK
jgi:multidrug efflux pump subunit AcrA (membrane-fusion protein)